MVHILAGRLKHVAHAWRKIGLRTHFDCSWQMPWADQITEIAPPYFGIQYKHHIVNYIFDEVIQLGLKGGGDIVCVKEESKPPIIWPVKGFWLVREQTQNGYFV